MAQTPWGNTEELSGRRLAPGRGHSREEVDQNQRERLFAAMVATVAEKGYEGTTVADVLELAGVSRKTFYRHFADKAECFAETLAVMLDTTVAVLRAQLGRGGQLGSGEEALAALLGAAAAQPAAAKVCVIEAFTAGPSARAKLERAVGELEWLAADLMVDSKAEEAAAGRVPQEMARALLGGIGSLSYHLLAEGRAAELPKLAEPLWRWAASLEPPRRPLPRRHDRSQREAQRVPFAAHVPTERLVRAFAAALAEHGYAQTSIGAIASRARISLSTFYEQFAGKQEALWAALASTEAQLLTAALPAARSGTGGGASVRVALAAVCEFLASEPELARLWTVEVTSAGAEAVLRRDRGDQEIFETVMMLAFEGEAELEPVAVEATLGALHALAYERVQVEGPRSLPGIVPLLTYVALVPFFGAETAYAAASGEEGTAHSSGGGVRSSSRAASRPK